MKKISCLVLLSKYFPLINKFLILCFSLNNSNEQGISAVDAPVAFGAVNCAMRELGVSKSEVLCYATSADYNNDTSNVVGYSAAVWRKE
jgi:hypothetical protein